MCFIEKVEILESWVVFAFITHFVIPYRDGSLLITTYNSLQEEVY